MIFGPRRRRDALKNVQAERNTFLTRSITAAVLAAFGLALLVTRLFDLQVTEHSYFSTRADANRMRVVPVGKEMIIQISVATLAPIVPLALTLMPLEELLRKLLGILL